MSNSLSLPLPERQDEEEDDEEDVERTYRLRLIPRSSPTPRKRSPACDDPGEAPPGRKVSFADARGLELARVRYFQQYPEPEEEVGTWTEPAFWLCPAFGLAPAEQLLDLVRQRKVELESARCPPDDPLSVHCLARVLNLSYQKVVQARCTLDEWATHYDHPADYVPGSSDGTSDQFAFRLPFPDTCARDGARLHFVLRYETPGGVYWANNGGANYTVVCRASEGTGREAPPPQGTATCLKSCLKATLCRYDDEDEDTEHPEWDRHSQAISPRPLPSHTPGPPPAGATHADPGAHPSVLIPELPVSSERIADDASPPSRPCDRKVQVPEVRVMDPESKGLSPPCSVLFVPIQAGAPPSLEGAPRGDVTDDGPEAGPPSLEGAPQDGKTEAEPEQGPPSLEGAPQCDWAEGGPLSLEGALQDDTETGPEGGGPPSLEGVIEVDKMEAGPEGGPLSLEGVIEADKMEAGPEGGPLSLEGVIEVDKMEAGPEGGPLSLEGVIEVDKMEAGPEGGPPSLEGAPQCVWTKGGPPSLEGAMQADTMETGPERRPPSLEGAMQGDKMEAGPKQGPPSLEGPLREDVTEAMLERGPPSLEGAPRCDWTEAGPEPGAPPSPEGEDDWRGSEEAGISLEGEGGAEREGRSARLYTVPGLHVVGACAEEEEEEGEEEERTGGGTAIPQDPGSALARDDPDIESIASLCHLLGTTLRVTEVLILLVVALSESGSVVWCTLYLFTLLFT